jgi:hypothetical protein
MHGDIVIYITYAHIIVCKSAYTHAYMYKCLVLSLDTELHYMYVCMHVCMCV